MAVLIAVAAIALPICTAAPAGARSGLNGVVAQASVSSAKPASTPTPAASPKPSLSRAVAQTLTGTISGTVTDPTGSPIAGVLVQAWVPNGSFATAQATTAADGTYQLTVPALATYQVLFNSPPGAGLAGQWWNDQPTQATANTLAITQAGQGITGINAQLHTLPAVSGTVTGPGGAAVGGAVVNVYANGSTQSEITTTTAADGTYRITGLIPGNTYLVQFQGPAGSGLAEQWWNNRPDEESADALPLTPGTTTQADAALQQPATTTGALTGVVTDTGGSIALQGATVVVHNYFGFDVTQTVTNSRGGWSVTNLPPGVYRVEFQPPTGSSDLPQWYNNEPDAAHSDGVGVASGTVTEGINAALVPAATIAGTVTDANGPVAGATVGVFSLNSISQPVAEIAHTTTGADGSYSIGGLAGFPAAYDVLFTPPAGSTDPGQWYAGPLGSSTATGSPTLAGALPVRVSDQTTVAVDNQLTAGAHGSISGTVTDRGGNPVGGATIEAVAADGTIASTATTAADGIYTITGLDVGIDTVWFLPPAGSSYRASIWNLAAGKILPVVVDQGAAITGINATLSQSGTVSGVVSGSSGPIAGATVTVTNYYGFTEASATTAADGSYTVSGLQPGSSRVEFTASGFVTQWWNNEPDIAHSNTIGVPNNGTATANATLAPSG